MLVAMSGGVDSSVAAAMLLDLGYDVTGVTLKLWFPEENIPGIVPAESGCCSLDDIHDARKTASGLGIPYYVMNFKNLFKDKVVDYFVGEYQTGRTPNPCIACNRYIKIGGLLPKALSMGFDYIATGHYARIIRNEVTDKYELHRGLSAQKDQSYVLYYFTQKQLAHTLFPLGDLTKEQVRDYANRLRLPAANKKDSQDICFVPSKSYQSVVFDESIPARPQGLIKDFKGHLLGTHRGIEHYTIGQRKGLGIAAGEKLFVYQLDPDTNTVYVGPEECLFHDTMSVSSCHFISTDTPEKPIKLQAKIRYASRAYPGMLIPETGGGVRFLFTEPVRAITPGQAAVFYDGDCVVGGGIIDGV